MKNDFTEFGRFIILVQVVTDAAEEGQKAAGEVLQQDFEHDAESHEARMSSLVSRHLPPNRGGRSRPDVASNFLRELNAVAARLDRKLVVKMILPGEYVVVIKRKSFPS